MDGERDWSGLPADVIHLIFHKLSDLLDFVQFRAVCKAWCSAASLSDLPMYLPWLLKCECCWYGDIIMGDHIGYYSISSDRTGTIDVKDTSMRSFIGPNCGYILLRQFGKLALFNPLTEERVPLPRRDVWSIWPIWTGVDSNLIHDQDIILVNRSLDDPNELGNWSFYYKENRQWITEYGNFYSCCYFQGRLFCTVRNLQSYTVVYDVSTKKQMYEILSPDNEDFQDSKIYLVEAAGIILRVFLRYEGSRNVENATFRIYKLDFGEKDGQPCWVKVASIDDQMLFLDFLNGFSISSTPFRGLRGNCIYFLYSKEYSEHGRPYKYDIELGTIERMKCPFKCCSWFVPCLN